MPSGSAAPPPPPPPTPRPTLTQLPTLPLLPARLHLAASYATSYTNPPGQRLCRMPNYFLLSALSALSAADCWAALSALSAADWAREAKLSLPVSWPSLACRRHSTVMQGMRSRVGA